jgi:triphosphoribosyl-dephospho-CoA synthetase
LRRSGSFRRKASAMKAIEDFVRSSLSLSRWLSALVGMQNDVDDEIVRK